MEQMQIFKNEIFGQIRILDKENGISFLAKDVCSALELENVGQALSRLDEDERNTIILNDGNPGNPEKAIINESGLYSLVLSSRKPEAKAFKKWVTSEVLPAIRKTGGYQISNGSNLVAAMTEKLAVAKLLEVPTHIAQIETLKTIKRDFNVDYTDLLQHAPAQNNIKEAGVMLEPTELGKLYNISGIAINKKLEQLGLQSKINGVWIPTDTGKPFCLKHAWISGNKRNCYW